MISVINEIVSDPHQPLVTVRSYQVQSDTTHGLFYLRDVEKPVSESVFTFEQAQALVKLNPMYPMAIPFGMYHEELESFMTVAFLHLDEESAGFVAALRYGGTGVDADGIRIRNVYGLRKDQVKGCFRTLEFLLSKYPLLSVTLGTCYAEREHAEDESIHLGWKSGVNADRHRKRLLQECSWFNSYQPLSYIAEEYEECASAVPL